MPSFVYPDFSDTLTLTEVLDEECNHLFADIIVETANGSFEAIITEWSNGGLNIKLNYDNVVAGYAPAYELVNCDIINLRCKICCDKTYRQVSDCDLTDVIIEDALTIDDGVNIFTGLPSGDVYLYGGSLDNPDCLYNYVGQGAYNDPLNWRTVPVDVVSLLQGLQGQQLQDFITFLASKFTGSGVTFTVHGSGDLVLATVGGGGAGGTISSFAADFISGTISHDANDGNGPTQVTMVTSGDVIPAPATSFFHHDTLTDTLYVNIGGVYTLLGVVGTTDVASVFSCENISECIENKILEPEVQDEYIVDTFAADSGGYGIQEVVYGPSGLYILDLTDCSAAPSFSEMITNLQDTCPKPVGWDWVDDGGTLVLKVPIGQEIHSVTFGVDTSTAKVWGGVPDINPAPPSVDLCAAIVSCMETRNPTGVRTSANVTSGAVEAEFAAATNILVIWKDALGNNQLSHKSVNTGWIHQDLSINSFEGNASTGEAAIEAAYASYVNVEVRWVDTDGDQRVSYKDAVNGWYHPVTKEFTAAVNLAFYESVASVTNIGGTDVLPLPPLGVPSDAKFVILDISTFQEVNVASVGLCSTYVSVVGANNIPFTLNEYFFTAGAHGHLVRAGNQARVKLKPTIVAPTDRVSVTYAIVCDDVSMISRVSVDVVGWER